MKLVSLNTWGGRQGQLFFDFIKEQASSADIFCLQEVFSSPLRAEDFNGVKPNLLQQLSAQLLDFNGHFVPFTEDRIWEKSVNFPVQEGLAVFVRKSLKAVSIGSAKMEGEPEYKDTGEHFSLQHVELELSGRKISLFNIHGLAFPGTKIDTPKRLEQSKLIVAEAKKGNPSKIICGDFNLLPETESIKLLEEQLSVKNLIKEYSIQNTRNEISWNRYDNKQHFADFTFLSPDIIVKNFEVPYNLASDHLAMILTFDL